MGVGEVVQSNRFVVVAATVLVVVCVVLGVLWWRDSQDRSGGGSQVLVGSGSPFAPHTATRTPAPTFRCSTASGSGCTKELAAKEAARDEAYLEARAAYRTFQEMQASLLRKDGPRKVPADIARIAGPDVIVGVQAVVDLYGEKNWALYGNSKPYFKLDEKSPEWPTNEILLSVCSDDTNLTMLNRKTNVMELRGSIYMLTAQMRKDAGAWKPWGVANGRKVKSCPAGYE